MRLLVLTQMPEPDPRLIRLAEMQERLLVIGEEIKQEPFGSPAREALLDRFASLLVRVLELREALKGD